MVKVYAIISEQDGCPATIVCIKTTKDGANKYIKAYALERGLERSGWQQEVWYADESEVVHVSEEDLED